MALRSTIAGALLLLGLGALAWRQPWRPAEIAIEPAAPPTADPGAATTPPVAVLRYGPPKTVREPGVEARKHLLALPNGEFVPTLNGVIDAPAMTWPVEVPYSPIIGTERDAGGQEWYVHADGARSTTTMVFRSDEGRLAPSTSLALPKPPAKVQDGG